MKKLLAFILAAVCALSISVTPFAASTSIVGNWVDSDGKIANDSYDTMRPGSSYYYVIGPSSDYGLLTDESVISFSLKKREGSKYIGDSDIVEMKFDGTRYVCIKLAIKDNFSADEYKVVLDANFRAKKNLVTTNIGDVANGAFPIFKVDTTTRASAPDLATAKAAFESQKKKLDDANKVLAAAVNDLAAKEKSKTDYFNTTFKPAQDAVTNTAASLTAANQELARLQGLVTAAQAAVNTAQANLDATANAQTDRDNAVIAKANAEAAKTTAEADQANAAARKLAFDPIMTAFTALGATPDATAIATWNALLSGYTAITITPLDATATNLAAVQLELTNEQAAVATAITNADTAFNNAVTAIGAADAAILAADAAIASRPALQQKLTDAQAAFTQAGVNVTTQQGSVAAAQTAANQAAAALPALQTEYDNRTAAVTAATTAKSNAQIGVDAVKPAYDAAKLDYENALKGVSGTGYLKTGETLTTTFKLWIQNENREDSDTVFYAGEKGVVIKPVKNELNTVTWENSEGNIAVLKFVADSESSFYCPRLSTKWTSGSLADKFKNQDAYLFDFVGNPTIPASTRPTVSLYNPFVDRNGDTTIKPSKLYVYEVVDGKLIDATSRFTPEINDDGDQVLTTKTRTLGTYIVAEKKVKTTSDSSSSSRPNNSNDNSNDWTPSNPKPIPNTGRA